VHQGHLDSSLILFRYKGMRGVHVPGVGLMLRVAGLGSEGPEFKSCFAVELIPGGVDSACHPSEVDNMSTNLLG